MNEQQFLNENGVSVSNVRFIANGQTYAMSGLTAVKTFRKDPPRKIMLAIAAIGVIELLSGWMIFGSITLASIVIAWFLKKPEFSVILSSASGENRALTSKDGEFISRVVGALNNAIVHRG